MTTEFGKLTITAPDQEPQDFVIAQDVVTIGSAETNDIVIKRAKVSRTHARITVIAGTITIYDLESSTGTQVNNQKVKQVNLASGDVIKLGEAELRFASAQESTPTDATVLDAAIFDTTVSGESLQEPATDDKRTSLLKMRTEGNKTPLFVITAGYSNIALLGHLAERLGDMQPFYALQPLDLPTLSDLVNEYIKQIKSVQESGPYQIAGYNIGGMVALEVAQRLQVEGHIVSQLALIDTPYTMNNMLAYWNQQSARQINQAGQAALSSVEKAIGDNMVQQVSSAIQAVRDTLFNTLPVLRDVEDDYEALCALIEDEGYNIQLRLLQSYQAKLYPNRAVLFLATRSPVRYSGAHWFWQTIIPNGLEVSLVEGSFVSILKDPDVLTLAEQLEERLVA